MKNFLFVFLLIFTIPSFGQQAYDNGKISIEYFSSEKISNKLHLNSSTKIRGNELQKISVKCKIKSLNKEKVDINKFSLIDTVNKIRYRPTDVSFQPVAGYMGYVKLLRSDIKKKGLIGYYTLGAIYRPEIKDTFLDYKFEGYTNYEVCFNFWTKKDPLVSFIYFKPHKFKKFKALLFFPLITSATNPVLELYYGNEKVSDVNVKDLK